MIRRCVCCGLSIEVETNRAMCNPCSVTHKDLRRRLASLRRSYDLLRQKYYLVTAFVCKNGINYNAVRKHLKKAWEWGKNDCTEDDINLYIENIINTEVKRGNGKIK